jgi:2'-5' RNA ligase
VDVGREPPLHPALLRGPAAGAMTRAAAGLSPFEIEIAGAGVFPSWKRPRVLWLGTGEGRLSLSALSVALEREFRAGGLGDADKPFVPHLTLGRWRESRGTWRRRPARSARWRASGWRAWGSTRASWDGGDRGTP